MGNALVGWNATPTETCFKMEGRDLHFWQSSLTLLTRVALKHLRLGSKPELVDPQPFGGHGMEEATFSRFQSWAMFCWAGMPPPQKHGLKTKCRMTLTFMVGRLE